MAHIVWTVQVETWPWRRLGKYWVAVKKLKLHCFRREPLSFATCPYYGNLTYCYLEFIKKQPVRSEREFSKVAPLIRSLGSGLKSKG